MTTKLMIGSLYNALRRAGVDKPEARAASEDVASFNDCIVRVEADLTLLKWMVGANLAISIAIMGRLIAG